jgi:hypothetical protein
MEVILLSSQTKPDAARFQTSFPIALRAAKRMYLVGYAFKDLVAEGSNTGALVFEILPFRFTWVSATGLGEGRITLPTKAGVNQHWFSTPVLIADATSHLIPPLKELEVRVFQAHGSGTASEPANLAYLHLWLGYEL